jgi:hypothetical protein
MHNSFREGFEKTASKPPNIEAMVLSGAGLLGAGAGAAAAGEDNRLRGALAGAAGGVGLTYGVGAIGSKLFPTSRHARRYVPKNPKPAEEINVTPRILAASTIPLLGGAVAGRMASRKKEERLDYASSIS